VLVAQRANAPTVGRRMNPVIQVDGGVVVLHPLDRVSVNQLGAHMGQVQHQAGVAGVARRVQDEILAHVNQTRQLGPVDAVTWVRV